LICLARFSLALARQVDPPPFFIFNIISPTPATQTTVLHTFTPSAFGRACSGVMRCTVHWLIFRQSTFSSCLSGRPFGPPPICPCASFVSFASSSFHSFEARECTAFGPTGGATLPCGVSFFLWALSAVRLFTSSASAAASLHCVGFATNVALADCRRIAFGNRVKPISFLVGLWIRQSGQADQLSCRLVDSAVGSGRSAFLSACEFGSRVKPISFLVGL